MLRYSILFFFIFIFSVYAFKDWFKSLCGLVFLMSVMERADMPRGMLGIPGLNPYNILLLFVIIGWLISRNKEQRKWDMPTLISFLLFAYFLIIITSVARFLFAGKTIFLIPGLNPDMVTNSYVIMNYLINSLKYVIPGLLIYDGCREEKRTRLVAYTLMVTFFLLALQTISRIGFADVLNSDALQHKAARILGKTPGYFRVELAALLAAAVWVFFCATQLFPKKRFKQLICLACSGICALALLLTAGRTGYGTCVLLGIFFAVFRWRSLMIVGPAAIVLLITFVPAARDRLLEGFDESTHETSVEDLEVDGGMYAITSGRTVVWPFALERIGKNPIFGYGFHGWLTTGGHLEIYELLGAPWAHPHNAYLQFIIDNGLLATLLVLWFFSLVLIKAFRLFINGNYYKVFIGGTCIALVLATLISAFGALSFYPKAIMVFMWCSIGLAIRYAYHPPQKLSINAESSFVAPEDIPFTGNPVERI